jgi:hypothetical protein
MRKNSLVLALVATAPAMAEHKPFVMVPLPAPEGYTVVAGHVKDLSGFGDACGFYEDGDGDFLPFFFDADAGPLGVTRILPLPTGDYQGQALGLNDADSGSAFGGMPHVVGYVENASGVREAVHWIFNTTTQQYELNFVGDCAIGGWTLWQTDSLAEEVVKTIIEAPIDRVITGWRMDGTGGGPRLFRYNLNYDSTPDDIERTSLSFPTAAYDLNAERTLGGFKVASGDLKSFWWSEDGTSGVNYDSPQPGQYEPGAILAMNWVTNDANPNVSEYSDLVGWVLDGTRRYPAVWEHLDNGSYALLRLVIADGGGMLQTSAVARDVNDHDNLEVVISLSDVEDDADSGGWLWHKVGDPNDPNGEVATLYKLDHLVQPPATASGAIVHRATTINDHLWIGGSFKADANARPMPCLLIPHNVDNNRTPTGLPRPDFRDLKVPTYNPYTDPRDDDFDHKGDSNPNWIPDDFEGLRVGMFPAIFGPQGTQLENQVNHMRAIRIHLDQNEMHAIVHNGKDVRQIFENGLSAFGVDGRKELIVTIRTKRKDDPNDPNDPDNADYIPPDSPGYTGEITREQYLEDLATFARRYARCIDYIALGNEFLSGPGQFYLEPGDLTGCAGWTGGLLRDVDGACFEDACGVVFDWMREQVNVARHASALGGRPLRFITPALHVETLFNGYGGDPDSGCYDVGDPNCDPADRHAFIVDCLASFANDAAAAVDLHLHYQEAAEIGVYPGYLVDPNAGWEVPELVTCLEWSPIPTGGWLAANNEQGLRYFDPTGRPCPDDPWDTWVDNWAAGVFGQGGYDLPGDASYLNGLGFLHMCYGNFGQNNDIDVDNGVYPDVFDVTAVRANKVLDNTIDCIYLSNQFTDKFTKVRERLESAGQTYSNTLGPDWRVHDAADLEACGCDTGN